MVEVYTIYVIQLMQTHYLSEQMTNHDGATYVKDTLTTLFQQCSYMKFKRQALMRKTPIATS